jgi:hypothetical protein
MISSTVWSMSCLVVQPGHAQSAAWRCAVGSPGTIAASGEWLIGLTVHCSCMSTRLARIKCVAYPFILQAHDGPDVKCLGNMRTCLETRMRSSTRKQQWRCQQLPLRWLPRFSDDGREVMGGSGARICPR